MIYPQQRPSKATPLDRVGLGGDAWLSSQTRQIS